MLYSGYLLCDDMTDGSRPLRAFSELYLDAWFVPRADVLRWANCVLLFVTIDPMKMKRMTRWRSLRR